MSEALTLDRTVVEYPTSDGRPVAETPLHYRRMRDLGFALEKFFEHRPDAYVGINMLVYDEAGNPRRHLSPDIFVAFDAAQREREIYKLWEEPAPSFVVEVTSKSTRREDRRKKKRYARWGVAEYCLYDPRGEYMSPALQVFERLHGSYRPKQASVLPNGERGFRIATLGLCLWLDGPELRFYDPDAGRTLPTIDDLVHSEQDAKTRAASESAARQAAQEKVASESAARQAAQEKAASESAARQAAQEKAASESAARQDAEAKASEEARRRRKAEAELAELRACYDTPASNDRDGP